MHDSVEYSVYLPEFGMTADSTCYLCDRGSSTHISKIKVCLLMFVRPLLYLQISPPWRHELDWIWACLVSLKTYKAPGLFHSGSYTTFITVVPT